MRCQWIPIKKEAGILFVVKLILVLVEVLLALVVDSGVPLIRNSLFFSYAFSSTASHLQDFQFLAVRAKSNLEN